MILKVFEKIWWQSKTPFQVEKEWKINENTEKFKIYRTRVKFSPGRVEVENPGNEQSITVI
jgi:hypothetical protein